MDKEAIHALYEKWVKDNIKDGEGSGDLHRAINRIEEINPSRSKQCQSELLGHISALCFFAANYGSKEIEDRAKLRRDLYKTLANQILAQEKATNKILSFFKASHDIANDALNIGCDLLESPLTPNVNLANHLEIYITGLNLILKHIKEDPLLCCRVLGALEYPEKLENQTYRQQPEVNSFLFNTTFLFRNFSNTSQDDSEWLPTLSGEMPTFGKPYHSIISDLASPIFPSLELDEKSVPKRIDRLVKHNVKLTSWLNTPL